LLYFWWFIKWLLSYLKFNIHLLKCLMFEGNKPTNKAQIQNPQIQNSFVYVVTNENHRWRVSYQGNMCCLLQVSARFIFKNESCVLLRCAKFPSLIINAGLQVLYFPMFSLKLKRIAWRPQLSNEPSRSTQSSLNKPTTFPNQPPETGSRLKWRDIRLPL
jgi:hypothetical protein